MKHWLFFFSLLNLHGMMTACTLLPMPVNSQPPPQIESKTFHENVMLKVSLLSRENKLPPVGIPNQSNRDIGFATVFLSLENHQEKNQTVTIKNIEIRNASDLQLQSFSFETRQIELKPLENSVIDIHLANKIGYVGEDPVKAIVTYQIGSQVNVIESEAVEVEQD